MEYPHYLALRCIALCVLIPKAFAQGDGIILGGGVTTRSDVSKYANLALDLRDIRASSDANEMKGIYREGRNAMWQPGYSFRLRNLYSMIESASITIPDAMFHKYGLAGRSTSSDKLEAQKDFSEAVVENIIATGKGDLAADAVIALDMWLYASHLLHSGFLLCEKRSQADSPDSVDIGVSISTGGMDEFIALWIGKDQEPGDENGHGMYAWAERAAELFNARLSEASSNTKIKVLFQEGAAALSVEKACTKDNKKTAIQLWYVVSQIKTQMMVPLFQWLIFSVSKGNEEATAAYAKALVPQISQCRPTLFTGLQELLLDDGVQLARSNEILDLLRQSLDCFRIKCSDIGTWPTTAVECKDRPQGLRVAGFATSTDVSDVSGNIMVHSCAIHVSHCAYNLQINRLDLDIYQTGILGALNSFDYAAILYRYGKNSPKHRDSETDPFTLLSLKDLAFSADRRSSKYFKRFISYHSDRGNTYGHEAIEQALTNTGKWKDRSPKHRAEVIEYTAAFQILYLELIGLLQDAYTACEQADAAVGFQAAVNPLDKAAALFTGSMEGEDHRGSLKDGRLVFDLANELAYKFSTQTDQRYAKVNKEIDDLLYAAKGQLDAPDCIKVERTTIKLQKLVLIPLLQGLLEEAEKNAALSPTDDKASVIKGEVIALALLPEIHAVFPNDASVISKNMLVQDGGDLVEDGVQTVANVAGHFVSEGLDLSCSYLGHVAGKIEPCRNYGSSAKAQRWSTFALVTSVVVVAVLPLQ